VLLVCTTIRNGGVTEFDFALDQYYKTNSSALKTDIIAGLTCSKEGWLLSKLLEGEGTLTTIRNIAVSPYGNSFAWNYLKSNWNKLYQR
jgi:hypothetical protein